MAKTAAGPEGEEKYQSQGRERRGEVEGKGKGEEGGRPSPEKFQVNKISGKDLGCPDISERVGGGTTCL